MRRGWWEQGVPAASLRILRPLVPRIRRLRHDSILILGADAEARTRTLGWLGRIAEPQVGLHVVSLPTDLDLLQRSLIAWLGLGFGPAPLRIEGGTLYIEGLAEAPQDVQRLLLQLCDRLLELAPPRRPAVGPSRLAAGLRSDPAEEVQHGRLLAGLIDRIDRFRVDLRRHPPVPT